MRERIKLKNLSPEEIADLPDCLILLAYRGSIAHNMYIQQTDPKGIDDRDIMGVYVAPLKHYLGFGGHDAAKAKRQPRPADSRRRRSTLYSAKNDGRNRVALW